MPKKEKKVNLIDQVLEELQKLNDQITTRDRKHVREKLNISKQLLSNYMNGRGADLDTATDILVLLRERVSNRQELIAMPL